MSFWLDACQVLSPCAERCSGPKVVRSITLRTLRGTRYAIFRASFKSRGPHSFLAILHENPSVGNTQQRGISDRKPGPTCFSDALRSASNLGAVEIKSQKQV